MITSNMLKDALLEALDEYFDEGEEEDSDVEQLEAITVAMIKSLRERIDAQDKQIADLKKRQYFAVNEPILLGSPILPDSPYGGWTITCKH